MKKTKRQLEEELEILDETGQESEHKAAEAVIEVNKEAEKKEKKKEERFLEELDMKRKQKAGYKEKLLYFLHNMISEIEFPYGYQWGVWYDGKGVVLSVVDPNKKTHKRAFIPCHDPKYDLHQCYMYAVWVDDLIDQNLGKLYVPPKIWTPTKLN